MPDCQHASLAHWPADPEPVSGASRSQEATFGSPAATAPQKSSRHPALCPEAAHLSKPVSPWSGLVLGFVNRECELANRTCDLVS